MHPSTSTSSVPHPAASPEPGALKDCLFLLALEICLVVAVIGLAILAARPGEYAPDDPRNRRRCSFSLEADWNRPMLK